MTCAPAIEFRTHRMEVVDNMAREYGKVWFSIFTDEHFTAQPAVDKLLYIALIAQPSLNYAGVQPINMRRLRKAMRDGDSLPTERELELSLLRMERLGYVYTDEDTGEILVRSFMRRDEIDKQPNVLKSALRALSQIESHKLAHVMRGELARLTTPAVKSEKIRDEIARLWTAAMTHLEGLAEGITEPLPEPFTEGLAEPLPRPGETEGLPEPLAEGLPEGSVVVEVEVVKSPTAFTQVLEKKKRAPKKSDAAPTKSIEQHITERAYERVGKAFAFIPTRQIAKWAIHDRNTEPAFVEDAIVGVYDMGKPITKQTVGQYLDGRLGSQRTRPSATDRAQSVLGMTAELLTESTPAKELRS